VGYKTLVDGLTVARGAATGAFAGTDFATSSNGAFTTGAEVVCYYEVG
jgi:hypothetical protein